MENRPCVKIYSLILIIIGIVGVFVSLGKTMLVNPLFGVLAFIISMGVLIMGIDKSDEHRKRNQSPGDE